MFARTAVKVLKTSNKVWCSRMEMLLPIFFYSFPFLPSRSPPLFALSLTGALWQSAILHGKNWNDKLVFDKLHKQKCFKSSARTQGAKINLTLRFLNSRGSFLQSHNRVWTAVEVHTLTETWMCFIPSHFLKIGKGPTYCKALGDAFRSQPPKTCRLCLCKTWNATVWHSSCVVELQTSAALAVVGCGPRRMHWS